MKNIINTFFKKLLIDIDIIDISIQKEYIYSVKIKTPDSGILIGPNGRNFDSIQNLLRLLLSKILNTKVSIHLEINDYIKTKDDRLFDFIKSKINSLEKPGSEIKLPFLNSYDRKKIHSFISDMNNTSLSTKSIGEGKERRLYICKAAAKLTIDIDGDDI